MPRVLDTDLYATLGVAPSATSDEIAAAFRALAKEAHPDRHAGDAAIAEHFKALTSAYDVLIRPESRAAYDRRRSVGTPSATRSQPSTAHSIFKTTRSARIALWSGVGLVLLGLGGVGLLASIDTGDTAKAITLWLVVVKLVICGAILWGFARWWIRRSETPSRVTGQ